MLLTVVITSRRIQEAGSTADGLCVKQTGANNCTFVALYSFPLSNCTVGLFYQWFPMRRKVEERIAVSISKGIASRRRGKQPLWAWGRAG